MNFNRPKSLQPGDKVAIISPSSGMPFLFPWVYEQGLRRLQEVFHLEPVEFPTARQSPDYLAKNPEARAQDINQAFADPSIKAIIATIGGNDQIRILPYLDKDILSANPKIFMGYSDNTNIHLFLWNLRIISYYGGAIMTQFAMGCSMHDYTITSIKKALFEPSIDEVFSAREYSDADLDWADKSNLSRSRPHYPCDGWIWHNCKNDIIEGQLWGGCLEVLALHFSIRSYLPAFAHLQGTILFLETSEEMPSEGFVYRFIAALGEMGLLKKFKAILMGYPKAQFCGKYPPEGREAFMLNQHMAVKNALKDYNSDLPVIFDMNFGHTDPQMIMPLGGHIKIDCANKRIFMHVTTCS